MSEPSSPVVTTILVVEDEPEFRRFDRVALERHGFYVVEAADGAEAVELAQADAVPIHLVLTDLIMPRLNGIALADRLQKLRPETEVLFMSGYVESVLFAARNPKAILLRKPFSPERLVGAVVRRFERDVKSA